MRFSRIVVLAVVAPVATNAFVPVQRQYTAPRTVLRKVEYDLDLGFEDAAPAKAAKKVAPAPVAAPVTEPASPPSKSKKRASVKKPAEAPVAVETKPKPAPVEKKKKEKAEKKKVTKKVALPPPPPPPPVREVKSASAFTKVGGVALGVAPLVLAPVVLLGAGRSVLQGTKDRREKIQNEVDEIEKLKRQKQLQAEVDGGELAKAVVRCVLMEISDLELFLIFLVTFVLVGLS